MLATIGAVEHILAGNVQHATDLIQGAKQKLSQGLLKSNEEPDRIFRLLLGACHFAVGEHFEAAQAWELCMQKPSRKWPIPKKWTASIEVQTARTDDLAQRSFWKDYLLRPAVRAFEKAGQIDRAITALQEAASSGAKKGDYVWLAKLHALQADYRSAYECILREKDELDPTIGEDLVSSTLLAVAGATGLPALEDYFARIKNEPPVVLGMSTVRIVLSVIWPEFSKLDEESADKFVQGLYWGKVSSGLGVGEKDRASWAIKNFGESVERELHIRLFQPFRAKLTADIKQAAERIKDQQLERLKDFILAERGIGLPEMIRLLSVRGGERVTAELSGFLNANFPREISHHEFQRIGDYRNIMVGHVYDSHGQPRRITLDDAESMLRLCQRMLSLLHHGPDTSRPASKWRG